MYLKGQRHGWHMRIAPLKYWKNWQSFSSPSRIRNIDLYRGKSKPSLVEPSNKVVIKWSKHPFFIFVTIFVPFISGVCGPWIRFVRLLWCLAVVAVERAVGAEDSALRKRYPIFQQISQMQHWLIHPTIISSQITYKGNSNEANLPEWNLFQFLCP